MPPLPGAEPLFAAYSYLMHLPILILVISLVYGATRYDDWKHILRESQRWVVRLTVFLLAVVLVLYMAASWF